MTTLRTRIMNLILQLEEQGHGGDSSEIIQLGHMLDVLDNSREVTEKVSHSHVIVDDERFDGRGVRVTVTAHKARVVLDD